MLLKQAGSLICAISQVLIDPVCMYTIHPSLLANFIYKMPSMRKLDILSLVDSVRYLFSRDIVIAESFCRKFAWHRVRHHLLIAAPVRLKPCHTAAHQHHLAMMHVQLQHISMACSFCQSIKLWAQLLELHLASCALALGQSKPGGWSDACVRIDCRHCVMLELCMHACMQPADLTHVDLSAGSFQKGPECYTHMLHRPLSCTCSVSDQPQVPVLSRSCSGQRTWQTARCWCCQARMIWCHQTLCSATCPSQTLHARYALMLGRSLWVY